MHSIDVPYLDTDRYVVLDLIGEGSYAKVVRLKDRNLNVQRAVKVLRREFLSRPVETARFAYEGQVLICVSGKWDFSVQLLVALSDAEKGNVLCLIPRLNCFRR